MKQLEELPTNYIREGTDKREVFPVRGMKAYSGKRGTVPLILSILTVDGGEWLTISSIRFTSGKEPR